MKVMMTEVHSWGARACAYAQPLAAQRSKQTPIDHDPLPSRAVRGHSEHARGALLGGSGASTTPKLRCSRSGARAISILACLLAVFLSDPSPTPIVSDTSWIPRLARFLLCETKHSGSDNSAEQE